MLNPLPAASNLAPERRFGRHLVHAVMALTALLTAACGSTVQTDASRPGGPVTSAGTDELVAEAGNTPDDFSLPGARRTDEERVSGRGEAGSGVSMGTAPAASTPGTSQGARQPTTPAGAPARESNQDAELPAGITDEEIKIGVTFQNDRAAANRAAFGDAVPDTGPPEERHAALLRWVNENGGVAGRKVSLVTRTYNSGEAANFEALQQSLCTYFTEDEPVYAVLPTSAWSMMTECLARRGVITFGSAGTMPYHDEHAFERDRGYIYYASTFNITRVARHTARGLIREGFLNADTVIGAVIIDMPEFRRAHEEAYKPELAAAGLSLTAEAFIAGDPGSAAAQINNAILRFRTEGVTHVTFLEPQGVNFVLWVNAAEQQRYRPKYGLNSGQYAGGLIDLFPTEQVRGSVGVGWAPLFDLNAAGDPGPTPGYALCDQIMRDAGGQQGDRVQSAAEMKYCDHYFLMKQVLDAATNLSPTAVQGTMEGLGSTYRPALTYGSWHGPGWHDGAGAYVMFGFDDRCMCFAARSQPRWLRR